MSEYEVLDVTPPDELDPENIRARLRGIPCAKCNGTGRASHGAHQCSNCWGAAAFRTSIEDVTRDVVRAIAAEWAETQKMYGYWQADNEIQTNRHNANAVHRWGRAHAALAEWGK